MGEFIKFTERIWRQRCAQSCSACVFIDTVIEQYLKNQVTSINGYGLAAHHGRGTNSLLSVSGGFISYLIYYASKIKSLYTGLR